MIGLEVSRFKIWYENYTCPDKGEYYIADRTLLYEDLDKLIEDCENTLANYGQKYYEEKAFGYECYDLRKHVKLQLLRDILLNHRMQIQWANFNVKPCLSDRNIQKATEEAKKLINYSCCRQAKSVLVVDNSKEADWIKKNPYCVAREKWEALAYKVCNDINLKVSVTQKACDIAYIVTSEEVDCTLQYAIDAYSKNCKIDFNLTIDEYNKYNCKATYDDCKKLAGCGISFDYILGVEKCNIDISYNEKDKCPEIKYKGHSVSFSELETADFDPENACEVLQKIRI